jgi:hypothetical protein
MADLEIKLGAAYSNGEFGNRWSVRQVLSIAQPDKESAKEVVTFKVLVGPGRRTAHSCSRIEFVSWARHEVVRNENVWDRVEKG